MKKNIDYILFGIGFIIMAASTSDIISIIASVLEKVFHTDLNAVFLSSVIFRLVILLIGGGIMFIGAILIKRRKDI